MKVALGHPILLVIAVVLTLSCASRRGASEPGVVSAAAPSDQSVDAGAEPPQVEERGTGTGTFTVEPVLCAYGENGVQPDQRGMHAPGWVVLVVDVVAPEVVNGVEVGALELFDSVTGERVSATLPIDVRVMSPTRSLDDLRLAPFDGQGGRVL
jgi:hypothetical protein